MEFNHIRQCWDYIQQAKDYKELNKRVGDIPNRFGSFSIEEDDGSHNCLVVNSWFDEQTGVDEEECVEMEDIVYPYTKDCSLVIHYYGDTFATEDFDTYAEAEARLDEVVRELTDDSWIDYLWIQVHDCLLSKIGKSWSRDLSYKDRVTSVILKIHASDHTYWDESYDTIAQAEERKNDIISMVEDGSAVMCAYLANVDQVWIEDEDENTLGTVWTKNK